MTGFEYKVVPAPMRGLKAKGVKGTPARFANALESVMNDLGTQGWEYQRTDTLPVEERQGLTGKTTSFQNMLVFRRVLVADAEDAPEVAALIEDKTEELAPSLPTPVATVPVPVEVAPVAAEPVVAVPVVDTAEAADETATADDTYAQIPDDAPTHVEDTSDTAQKSVENRVSKTLKAPFSFPWNNRSPVNRPAKDDSHIAAE